MEPIFSYETFPFPAAFTAEKSELPLSWEGILPEDLPDAVKILHLQITPAFEQKGPEVEGLAEISLLYADEAGEMRHFSAKTPFAKSLKTPADADVLWQVSVTAENPKVRLVNPRRLEVAAILVFSAKGFGPAPTSFISAAEPTLQCRFLPQKAAVLQASLEETWVEEGRFRVENEDFLSPADAMATVQIEECKSAEGKCFVRGQIHLDLLVTRPEEPLFPLHFDLPFAKMAECEAWADEGEVMCNLSLMNLSVTLPEGESPLLLVQAGLHLSAFQVQNRAMRYLADLYATDRACESKSGALSVPLCLGAVSERATCSENAPVTGKVTACFGEVTDFSAENRKGILTLCGQVALRLYLQGKELTVQKKLLNFEIPLPLQKSEEATFAGVVHLLSCKADEGGRISALLAAEGLAFTKQKRQVITGAELADTPEESAEKPLLFCRLEAGADLWQLAKAHHIPLASLQQENNLTGERLEEAAWLLLD